MMDRDYSARAEGDRVPCFEVTSTSGGETYVLRQRQLRDARGAYTTTSGARSRHDSQRLPPGDIAFLSAKAAMETSEGHVPTSRFAVGPRRFRVQMLRAPRSRLKGRGGVRARQRNSCLKPSFQDTTTTRNPKTCVEFRKPSSRIWCVVR